MDHDLANITFNECSFEKNRGNHDYLIFCKFQDFVSKEILLKQGSANFKKREANLYPAHLWKKQQKWDGWKEFIEVFNHYIWFNKFHYLYVEQYRKNA